MTSLSPTDYRLLRSGAVAEDRAYRDAYLAGHDDAFRERRRLVGFGVVLGALVVFRHHLHPLVALLWGLIVLALVSPLVLLVLAVETTVPQHRRWRSRERTMALVATWIAGACLVYLAMVVASPWPLLAVPLAIGAWTGEHLHRSRALRRQLPIRLASPAEDGPEMADNHPSDSYRVISTSKGAP